MKLRTRQGSLRLRLTRTEVARLVAEGSVEERVAIGPGPDAALAYAIVAREDERAGERGAVTAHAVAESGLRIVVEVPRALLRAWAEGDEVGIEARQEVAGAGSLLLLIEKDFTCLVPRAHEDDTDAYPNPAAAPSRKEPG